MRSFARLMFVLPLVMATAAVAILNGNVLCIAGDQHMAVEARHEGGCAVGYSVSHDGEHADPPAPGSCSDVSADFDLSRAGERSDAGGFAAGFPFALATNLAAPAAVAPEALHLPRSTAAPPGAVPATPLRSFILII